jgi:hypothetical protein
MFRAAVFALTAACCAPAAGAEILQIARGDGKPWGVGDRAPTVVTGDGRLAITMTVKKSPNAGQAYYVFAFETKTDMPVNFSARASDRPPQRTHFAARAEPARPYMWGEHLPAELSVVYVMYRASR